MKSDPLVHFTESTTSYWQTIESAVSAERLRPPFRFGYPALLPDGNYLVLPIRRREHKDRAVASFIADHASFAALDALADHMAAQAAAKAPDLAIGLPTLGLALAPLVARSSSTTRSAPARRRSPRSNWRNAPAPKSSASLSR